MPCESIPRAIDALITAVQEKGVPIQYGKKFSHFLSETETEVTWKFEDGTTGQTERLVGADGIHSRVRKYIYPDLEPKFTDAMGVIATVPTSHIRNPDGFQLPVTLMNPKRGAFVAAPQRSDGSELLIGKQRRAPELDREAKDISEIVQSAVFDIPLGKLNLWPFYVVPKLDTWASKHSRVVILGDAAHAIPPTAKQGVNQAFEDVYTFALILFKSEHNLERGLQIWQRGRQERIDRVLELNARIDSRHRPKDPNAAPSQEETGPFNHDWLYHPDFYEMVDGWLKKRTSCPLSAIFGH
ncbi:hypothetical protein N7512_005375 [Penicillium capsulatum]|nr:hypothetical protein N7512_005375 [Penicillium capsulatum]